ncbi:hypothetical protein GQ600_25696 [Phytophthora cactorum]|nr:hypothetical protein GQ600_25696 [Phytophthora cactorum]
MWCNVSSKFARSKAGSKKSGNHSDDFWDFCDGRAGVYYLHKWCEHRGSGREFSAATCTSTTRMTRRKRYESGQQKWSGEPASKASRLMNSWLAESEVLDAVPDNLTQYSSSCLGAKVDVGVLDAVIG